MKANYYTAPRQFRYFQHGKSEASVQWVALHGYRQLANRFVRKFESLNPDQHTVYAPEGPSRFYLDGHTGRVGASWMTKEDREHDIENYVQQLDAFYSATIAKATPEKKILLGFSQGAATAVRWWCKGKATFDELVIWAGTIPKDMDMSTLDVKLNQPVRVFIGDDDPFNKENHITSALKVLEDSGVPYELKTFAGGHDIDPNVLIEFANSQAIHKF